MLSIISGVPGTGKTGLIVDMTMDEIKTGRKVWTSGIPDLLLKVHKAGDLHTWQEGDWLKIDRYDPVLAKSLGMESKWLPRGCPLDCQYIRFCEGKIQRFERFKRLCIEREDLIPVCRRDLAVYEDNDYGSLIIVDESHIDFPQRASGKAPPPHVEALNVHRHQGLDIWFCSQRPSFLDPFVRGLSSRHIHLQLNAFSFTGSRNKYQWSEYQETVNRTSKLQAAKSSYKPMPHVFPLYASATVHTKLDQKMPNIMKAFIGVILVLALMVGLLVQRVNNRIESVNNQTSGPISSAPAPDELKPTESASGGQRTGHSDAVAVGAPVAPAWPFPIVDSCASTDSYCRCYNNGVRIPMEDLTCKAIVQGGWIKPRQNQDSGVFLPAVQPGNQPYAAQS